MRVRYRVGTALLTFLAFAAGEPALAAGQTAWQPSPGHTQLPIWPRVIPDAQPVEGPEVSGTVVDATGSKKLVGDRPWVYVGRVSQPTMTVYSPVGSNTGVAIVVFPGGGYNVLAIDLEGTEVCDWLTSKGITCVLLKYRVPCVKSGAYRDCRTALQDAQRTVGLVRFQAAQWHIDPNKIGVLGFSAGGHMVAAKAPPAAAVVSLDTQPRFRDRSLSGASGGARKRLRVEPRHSGHQADAAHVLAPGEG